MIKEEEKGEETEYVTAKDQTKTDVFLTAQSQILEDKHFSIGRTISLQTNLQSD
jgi:hypothetical protein